MTKTLIGLTAAAALLASTAVYAGGHTGGATLADDQTFTIRFAADAPTLDPQLMEDTTSAHIARQLFEGLINQDVNGENVPGVATEWSSPDNKVWTFKLREDAKWSNGDPVTAQDFVYAWQRAADPATASPYGWYLEITEIVNAADIVAGNAAPDTMGVKAIDDHTLEVTLNVPLPYFPSMTTHATLYPAHKATIEANGDAWTQPGNLVGNGAYNLESRDIGEQITVVKSDTYWDAANVIIDKIVFYTVVDHDQALTRYEAGEFDMNEEVPAGQYPTLKEKYPDVTWSVPRLCSYYYAINHTDAANEALKDVRVRKAMSYAVDRNVIVDQVTKGGQIAAYNFTPAATAGFEVPEIDYGTWSQAERDAKAKELIEEAKADGVPVDDLNLKLIYNTSESHKSIATILGQMWKQKLGIGISLENMEWKTFLDVRSQTQFDLARSGWCADYNEASTFLDLLTTASASNDGKYSNPEYDTLMKDSKAQSDPQPNYTKAEEILAADMALIPIYHYTNVFMLDADIKGFPFENAENNWYVKDMFRVAE